MDVYHLIWTGFLIILLLPLVNSQLQNASYCYGDSSSNTNLVSVACVTGVVNVNAIIAASKPSSLGCPLVSHVGTPADPVTCCSTNDGDCFTVYDGDISSYQTCNGKKLCTGFPVIRTRTSESCSSDEYNEYTNYMVFQYRCVPDYKLYGACNTTEDCEDEYAICDNSICVCGPGSSDNNDKCYRDGRPGGHCNATVSCIGGNVGCMSNVCVCDQGFSAVDETCMEDGELGGICSDTIPCTDDKAVCSAVGVCECVSGYEERNSVCVKADIEIVNSTNCYGDNSNGDNLVNVSCNTGVIHLYDVVVGSKPLSEDCPLEDHIYTAADNERCCEYSDEDCLSTYTGDWSSYLACNGRRSCQGVPIIRQETDALCMVTGSYKAFSNYMMLRYYCVPDFRLHGACNSSEECTDDNAVCNKNVCECGFGYTEINDNCPADGSLGGRCNVTVPCEDEFAECSEDAICVCMSGYTASDSVCFQDGHVGGYCNSSITCVDTGSVCSSSSKCECTTGYTERNYVCIPDGNVGGKCSNGQCTQSNTICSNGNCVCESGYSEVNYLCKQDGDVLGKCDSSQMCDASNTVCDTNSGLLCGISQCDPGVCLCEMGYGVSEDETCVEDGRLGGTCSDTIACLDSNTVCSDTSGVCVCATGYGAYDGVCIEDGHIGGFCDSSTTCVEAGSSCSSSNRCECTTGYSEQSYVCIQDGNVGGKCSNGACKQSNTVCSNGDCVCNSGYSEVNFLCKQDGEVLGKCDSSQMCEASHTVCDTSSGYLCGISQCDPGVCMCETGYSVSADETCIEDGRLGGMCSDTISCLDSNTVCSDTSGRCVCATGYGAYDSICIEDGHIGGFCDSSTTCVETGSSCSSSNRCECTAGYSERSYVCIPDGNVGGKCSNGACTQSNTVCSNGNCVCDSGYSEVNFLCKQDGGVLGKCDSSQMCEASYTVCDTSSGLLCGILQCDPGVCMCETGYSASEDDTCIEDGHVGGYCDSSITCVDTGSGCSSSNKCECTAGYTERNYVCIPDGIVGGKCSNGQCTQSNAVCSNGNCVCQSGYSEVNYLCKLDGGVLGKCDPGQVCDDSSAVCDTTSGLLCGISQCDPGVCLCKTGYSVSGEVCVEDGVVGNTCTATNTCHDSNADCSPTNVCECKNGYTESDDVCVEDGYPGGRCLSMGTTCLDAHSVCSNGICLCNYVRNYKKEYGACIRKDGYIHGQCTSDSDCLATSSNSGCSTEGLCACLPGYSEQNGQCIKDTTSTVTACVGDDPFNSLQPDCPPGSQVLVIRELSVVKPASSSCPPSLDTYNGATYQVCCTPGDEDCVVVTSIAADCDPNIAYLSATNYKKIEYVCTEGSNVIEPDDDGSSTGSPVYLTSSGYPGTDTTVQSEHRCSVQASCLSNIDVYMLLNELQESGSECLQRLEITEGSGVAHFTCTSAVMETSIYTSTSGYFLIKVVNQDQQSRGKFVLKFEATTSTADVNVACGTSIDLSSNVLEPCPSAEGALDGACSATTPCTVANSKCVSGICQCASGFIRSDEECATSDAGGSSSEIAILAIIVPLVVLVLLALAAIAYFLLKDRIRRRFCPKEEPEKDDIDIVADIPPVVAGPVPMNTKFPGRDPFGPDKKKTLPPLMNQPLTEFIHKEQDDDIKKRNTLEKKRSFQGIHPSIHPGEDSVWRTRFKRSASSFALNGFSNGVAPIVAASATNAPTMNEISEKKEKKEKKRRKKRMKALQKIRGGIGAASAFQLPKRGTEGLDNFVHPAPALTPNGNVPAPPYPPVFKPRTIAPLPNNPGGQSFGNPQSAKEFLSRSFGGNTANVNVPNDIHESPFEPRRQWQRAGSMVSATSMPPFLRRPSVIEISTVGDPSEV